MGNGKPRCLVEELVELVPLGGSAATIAAGACPEGIACHGCCHSPDWKVEIPTWWMQLHLPGLSCAWSCSGAMGFGRDVQPQLESDGSDWKSLDQLGGIASPVSCGTNPSRVHQLRLGAKLDRMASKPSPVSQASWRRDKEVKTQESQDELQWHSRSRQTEDCILVVLNLPQLEMVLNPYRMSLKLAW